MTKREDFNNALKESLKEKDKVAMSTIRLIIAALKDRDIEARSKGNDDGINDSEIFSMLQSMIKQRGESAETYKNANRPELAEQEEQEIQVIKRFLPEPVSEEELNKIIDQYIQETGAESIKDMGKVMGKLKENYAGRVDMGAAGGKVKQKLG